MRPDARDSWRLGMPLLTCAGWLAREMREVGLEPLAVVPNAIDPDEFGLDRPLAGRRPASSRSTTAIRSKAPTC